jgi:hypothetical protein
MRVIALRRKMHAYVDFLGSNLKKTSCFMRGQEITVELAYNAQGEPFPVPSSVVAWRPRRMRPRGERGPLEPVYDRDTGRLLTVPVNATMDFLRARVDPGRYRLDGIGADVQVLPDVPPAYVEVIPMRNAPAPSVVDDTSDAELWNDRLPRASDNTEREAMRLVVHLAAC